MSDHGRSSTTIPTTSPSDSSVVSMPASPRPGGGSPNRIDLERWLAPTTIDLQVGGAVEHRFDETDDGLAHGPIRRLEALTCSNTSGSSRRARQRGVLRTAG